MYEHRSTSAPSAAKSPLLQWPTVRRSLLANLSHGSTRAGANTQATAVEAWEALPLEAQAHLKEQIVGLLLDLFDRDPSLASGLAHVIQLRYPWFRGA